MERTFSCIVTNEDVHDGTHTISAEVFTQDSQEDCLRLCTLNSVLQLHFPHFQCQQGQCLPMVSQDGIRVNERQFEGLISGRSNSDISGGIDDDLAPENESDSDEDVTKQIGRCNLPGRSRSNKNVKTLARLYDYF